MRDIVDSVGVEEDGRSVLLVSSKYDTVHNVYYKIRYDKIRYDTSFQLQDYSRSKG